MGLDPRLYMSSSNLPSVVFVFLTLGRGDLYLAMLCYSKRPDIFTAMTFCQFLMWFKEMRRGQEEAQPQHQGLPRAVVTAVDLASLPAPPPLPMRLHLQDGTMMVKRRQPCPVQWAPLGAHSNIVMFKVWRHLSYYLNKRFGNQFFKKPEILTFVMLLLQSNIS